jgi:phosphatidylserine/phosphatidylglycerophosphate/cardiolipin synthase-like enzyme
LIAVAVMSSVPALAREIAPAPNATYEALFTPGDPIDVLLVELIEGARSEVLVNAFSFTNRRIARALAAAHARGVHVEIVADRGQTLESPGSAALALARQGVPVWLDGNFAAAHNKVMIIDGESARGAVVTGSFNYTGAAQSRNAENVLIIRRDQALASQYRANFVRLRDRARRYDGTVSPRR